MVEGDGEEQEIYFNFQSLWWGLPGLQFIYTILKQADMSTTLNLSDKPPEAQNINAYSIVNSKRFHVELTRYCNAALRPSPLVPLHTAPGETG
jgi:hypothetical protein